MRTKYFILCLIILSFTVFSAMSYGQRDTANSKKSKIKAALKSKIIENIGVTDSVAEKVILVSKATQDDLKKLQQSKKQLWKEVEDNTDAVDVNSKIDAIMKIEQDILAVRINFVNNLRDFLTPQQVAKAIVFQNKFSKYLKKQLHKDGNNGDN